MKLLKQRTGGLGSTRGLWAERSARYSAEYLALSFHLFTHDQLILQVFEDDERVGSIL